MLVIFVKVLGKEGYLYEIIVIVEEFEFVNVLGIMWLVFDFLNWKKDIWNGFYNFSGEIVGVYDFIFN